MSRCGLALLLFATARLAAAEYESVHTYDPARDAVEDIAAAAAEAKRTDRLVLVEVGGEWCVWCHRLDAFLKENPDLAELLERNFVLVKVNYSPENRNEAALGRYPAIFGYPHFFVLDGEGRLLRSQGTGELEKGESYDKDVVRRFLEADWAKQPATP